MKKSILTSVLLLILFVAAKAQTENGKAVFENEKMKVTSFTSEPGKDVCGEGLHSHPAHLTILLTDADVKITMPDGKVVAQKIPAGTTFWSEAEQHSIVNNGKQVIKAYIVQSKP